MKIFVLHYSKLTDRKKHILEQFKKHNITDYEFVEKYDKDEITYNESSLFFPGYKKSTMSLHLKHIFVYKEIAEKYDCALIFEDDVILSDNFTDIFNKYMCQLPQDYDMLFIGDGCGLHIEKDKINHKQNIYKKCNYPTHWGGDGVTRCCDSYIVNRKCARKICDYINNLQDKIYHAVDWWLNIAARDNDFKVYWAEPTIVTQGSQNGTFKTEHKI